MNKEFAVSALNASLRRGSSTPCTWAPDREAYIAAKSAELLEAVIEPIAARISGESFSYGAMQELMDAGVYAIARAGTNWLIFAPAVDRFSLAFGERPEDLTILGFSSNDALAEWLG